MTPTNRSVRSWEDARFELTHAGDVLGRALGWAWRTDADKIFMRAVTDYAARSSRLSAMLQSIGTSGLSHPLRVPARNPYNVTVPKRVRAECNPCSHKLVLAEYDCCVSGRHAERTGMQQTPSYGPDYA
jgi:hypothetical protein